MRGTSRWPELLAGALVGAALGIGATAGGALLLYTGDGLLGTVGLLLGMALAALAAGLWVGLPPHRNGHGTGRWIFGIVAFLVAALFGELWVANTELQAMNAGRALGALLLVAEPSYAVGLALGLFRTPAGAGGHGRGGPVVAVLLGCAVGVGITAIGLIPSYNPAPVFLLGAIAFGGAWSAAVRDSRQNDFSGRRNSMKDRIAVVTGVGGRGQVGYAVAGKFLDEGASVLLTDVSAGLDECAESLTEKYGDRVAAVRADLLDPDGAASVVSAARERFGRVDALINVAGGLTVMKPVADTGDDEWERELDRNARTAFLMTRAALPALRENGGVIVNFAAPAGLRAVAGLGAYSAGKAGVVALTRATALEEREHGVRVNAIAPGMIDTQQNRVSVEDADRIRWVSREEIARVVLFLAGDESSGVTGEVVHALGP